MFTKRVAFVVLLASLPACGSSYTLIDRSSITPSPNSDMVAKALLPNSERNPQQAQLVQHLSLAEEIYQKQLHLLRQRRNKIRARKRDLNFASYGIMGATGLGVGGLAIGAAASDADRTQSLVGAGVISLVGLGLGTVLQLTAALQEEPSVADDKVRSLQRAYESMLERVRVLSHGPGVPGDPAQTQAVIASIIESFISTTLEINVKG